ncbi:hypothetical protein EHP00_1724 [Ecytonucleospora hepatopenaei]|uniref:FAD/NAD(P)-binding domain-containing protein n=1 Tax=Ecytonucleospora hepatopenaei TaxID=646526 RepID=A0A1W0E661_9MICR|nr:hypothetical protein EHP00_1724 [Ecytonucleospora hepatopenaei]
MPKNVIIIGNTPAAATCAIYFKTGNHNVTLLECDSQIPYKTTVVGGLEDPTKFTENSLEQCKWLGVNLIRNCGVKEIKKNNKNILVELTNSTTYESDIVVMERDHWKVTDLKDKNIFVMDLKDDSEGIVLAAEGCKVALEMK